jgi:hypothetical protein
MSLTVEANAGKVVFAVFLAVVVLQPFAHAGFTDENGVYVTGKLIDASDVFKGNKLTITAEIGDVIKFDYNSALYYLDVNDISSDSVSFTAIQTATKEMPSLEKSTFEPRFYSICKSYEPPCVLKMGAGENEEFFAGVGQRFAGVKNYFPFIVYLAQVKTDKGIVTLKVASANRETDLRCKPIGEVSDPQHKIDVVVVPGDASKYGYATFKNEEEFKSHVESLIKITFEGNLRTKVLTILNPPFDPQDKSLEAAKKIYIITQYRNDFNFYYVWKNVPCTHEPTKGIFSSSPLWDCDTSEIQRICKNIDSGAVILPSGGIKTLLQEFSPNSGRSNAGFFAYIDETNNFNSGAMTFAHEFGHSPLNLADEYQGDGGYWEDNPYSNLYEGNCLTFFKKFQKKYSISLVTPADCTPVFDLSDMKHIKTYSRLTRADVMSEVGQILGITGHSYDNMKVIDCTIKHARGEKCSEIGD